MHRIVCQPVIENQKDDTNYDEKRMPVSQAMTASVGEKRKRLDGKVFEEPPVIPCTAEELNYVLDK